MEERELLLFDIELVNSPFLGTAPDDITFYEQRFDDVPVVQRVRSLRL